MTEHARASLQPYCFDLNTLCVLALPPALPLRIQGVPSCSRTILCQWRRRRCIPACPWWGRCRAWRSPCSSRRSPSGSTRNYWPRTRAHAWRIPAAWREHPSTCPAEGRRPSWSASSLRRGVNNAVSWARFRGLSLSRYRHHRAPCA